MTKKTNSISINVLSVLIILMSLLIGVIGVTNSWFTAEHQNGIYIQMEIGDLKLNLYKNSVAESNIIYTYEANEDLTQANKKFVPLSGEIQPDATNSLVLVLSNEDKGSASMYIRYKLELYRRNRGTTADSIVPIEIVEYTPANSSDNRFRLATDGYYYYQNSTGAASTSYSSQYNVKLAKNTTATLLSGFVVPYSSFFDGTGNLLQGSDSLYLKLTVEASVLATF